MWSSIVPREQTHLYRKLTCVARFEKKKQENKLVQMDIKSEIKKPKPIILEVKPNMAQASKAMLESSPT